jgi:hypothetical protein
MRIINQPSAKDGLEDGKTYVGTITGHVFKDITSKKNGKKYKLVEISIRPDDEKLKNAKASDFVGEDEGGAYVYKGSKLDTWLSRIFNAADLSSVTLNDLAGKKCMFVVEKTEKVYEDGSRREFFNASDIIALPVQAMASTSAAPQTPVTQLVQPSAKQVLATSLPAAKPAVAASDDWSNGQIL